MFQVTIGKEGLTNSWQRDFPETTECIHCKCEGRVHEARIGFVAFESPATHTTEPSAKPPKQVFVKDLHPNDGRGGYWLHDCCAVAVYFCRDCLKTTALYNQA
jgi:hypothetical protein